MNEDEFPDIGIELVEGMSNDSKTVSEHYGVTEEEFDEMCDDILCSKIRAENKPEVLDEYFSELDGEGRVKVVAYALATKKHLDMVR